MEEEGSYPALAFGRWNSSEMDTRLQKTPLPGTLLMRQRIAAEPQSACSPMPGSGEPCLPPPMTY